MSDLNGYRSSHLAKGADYHAEFSRNPRRALIWRLEQEILREIIGTRLSLGHFRHLDFACGTGRIINLLQPLAGSSVGVDLSPTMLSVAREQTPGAKFVQADITREDVLGTELFDLVTAFRFFPNAEPALRDAAMTALLRHLAPDGMLVFNNHCHTGGVNRRIVRLVKGKPDKLNDMSRAECESLIQSHALQIDRIHHIGVLPDYETRLLRPRWAVSALESLGRRLPLATIAENLIFVCHKRR